MHDYKLNQVLLVVDTLEIDLLHVDAFWRRSLIYFKTTVDASAPISSACERDIYNSCLLQSFVQVIGKMFSNSKSEVQNKSRMQL